MCLNSRPYPQMCVPVIFVYMYVGRTRVYVCDNTVSCSMKYNVHVRAYQPCLYSHTCTHCYVQCVWCESCRQTVGVWRLYSCNACAYSRLALCVCMCVHVHVGARLSAGMTLKQPYTSSDESTCVPCVRCSTCLCCVTGRRAAGPYQR